MQQTMLQLAQDTCTTASTYPIAEVYMNICMFHVELHSNCDTGTRPCTALVHRVLSPATAQLSCSISTHTHPLLPSCAHTLLPSCAHTLLLSCAHTLLPSCTVLVVNIFILHLGQHGLLSQTISLLPEFKVRMGSIIDKIGTFPNWQ